MLIACLVSWFLPNQARHTQLSGDSPNAKGSPKPNSPETDFICVPGEPGSHGVALGFVNNAIAM
jgi:hypothetical protein